MQKEMEEMGEEIYFFVCLSETEFYCVLLHGLLFTK